MKTKVSKAQINRTFEHIIVVANCEIHSLLMDTPAFAYSDRSEGWACDYYDVEGVCICEGYDPIRAKNAKDVDHETCRKWNDKALNIPHNHRGRRANLLRRFVKEMING